MTCWDDVTSGVEPNALEMIGLEIDVHIHSKYSQDCRSEPELILRRARETGLGAIAITDHNSWEGARVAERLSEPGFLVIPGAEIKTDKGDLLVLFVDEEIRSRVWSEVIDETRSRDGISIVPHPADSRRLTPADIKLADGIEAFNSSCTPSSNLQNLAAARLAGTPSFANSDAHMVREVGNGRTRTADCGSVDELRAKLLKSPEIARAVQSNWIVHTVNEVVMFGTKGIWRR